MMKKENNIQKKLNVLLDIANQFNQQGILWNLGSSCMLYLRNIVDDFHDIDFMVAEKDVDKVIKIMSCYQKTEDKKKNSLYGTRVFLNYQVHDVDIDIMAGFSINKDSTEHYFPLLNHDDSEVITIAHTKIYLANIMSWYNYYQLMDRMDKVEIIKKYLLKHDQD